MPKIDGIEATCRQGSTRSDTSVVVLTTYTDDDSVLEALAGGHCRAGRFAGGWRVTATLPRR